MHYVVPRKDLALRKAFVGAEPHTEETRRRIEQAFGCDVYNSYGLTEMNGPGVAFECEHKCGMHLWEDNFLMEIVDPKATFLVCTENGPMPSRQSKPVRTP